MTLTVTGGLSAERVSYPPGLERRPPGDCALSARLDPGRPTLVYLLLFFFLS